MKRIISLFAILTLTLTAMSQTLNVQMGEVTYQYPALQVGDMTYQDAQTLTILSKAYTLSQLDKIYIDNAEVTDNNVKVTYDGETAAIVVAGNVAQYLTVEANGAHVSITQADDLAQEITYVLSGSSTDGEFYLAGNYKASVSFEGLTLTNPNGAPINIQNGKRIEVSVKKDTENTLVDGEANTQKGTFVCKGHTEFKGKGKLNVYSHAANAIWSNEYVQVKNCTINIQKAAKDGINCNQYFLMESGSITITKVKDTKVEGNYSGDAYVIDLEAEPMLSDQLVPISGSFSSKVIPMMGWLLKLQEEEN